MKQEEFVERANKVHSGKYDYSKSIYENTDTKVCIICPEHGEFWQSPHHHLNGVGCPKCGRNDITEQKIFEEVKVEAVRILQEFVQGKILKENRKKLYSFRFSFCL